MKKTIVYLQMRGGADVTRTITKKKIIESFFKNGFIGGLVGGAVAVAGGVGIMAVTNPANQATTPATQPSQTQVDTTKTSTATKRWNRNH